MNGARALAYDEQILTGEYSGAVVQLHRECVRASMLARIVMFGCDEEFNTIVGNLAKWLDLSNREAADLLWPVSHRIFEAAAEPAHV